MSDTNQDNDSDDNSTNINTSNKTSTNLLLIHIIRYYYATNVFVSKTYTTNNNKASSS